LVAKTVTNIDLSLVKAGDSLALIFSKALATSYLLQFQFALLSVLFSLTSIFPRFPKSENPTHPTSKTDFPICNQSCLHMRSHFKAGT